MRAWCWTFTVPFAPVVSGRLDQPVSTGQLSFGLPSLGLRGSLSLFELEDRGFSVRWCWLWCCDGFADGFAD